MTEAFCSFTASEKDCNDSCCSGGFIRATGQIWLSVISQQRRKVALMIRIYGRSYFGLKLATKIFWNSCTKIPFAKNRLEQVFEKKHGSFLLLLLKKVFCIFWRKDWKKIQVLLLKWKTTTTAVATTTTAATTTTTAATTTTAVATTKGKKCLFYSFWKRSFPLLQVFFPKTLESWFNWFLNQLKISGKGLIEAGLDSRKEDNMVA